MTIATFTVIQFGLSVKGCLRSAPSSEEDTRAGSPNPAAAARDSNSRQERGTHTFLGAACASGVKPPRRAAGLLARTRQLTPQAWRKKSP